MFCNFGENFKMLTLLCLIVWFFAIRKVKSESTSLSLLNICLVKHYTQTHTHTNRKWLLYLIHTDAVERSGQPDEGGVLLVVLEVEQVRHPAEHGQVPYGAQLGDAHQPCNHPNTRTTIHFGYRLMDKLGLLM